MILRSKQSRGNTLQSTLVLEGLIINDGTIRKQGKERIQSNGGGGSTGKRHGGMESGYILGKN